MERIDGALIQTAHLPSPAALYLYLLYIRAGVCQKLEIQRLKIVIMTIKEIVPFRIQLPLSPKSKS